MEFSADGLPTGLELDGANGRITGKLETVGEYPVVFHASNSLGHVDRPFKIIVGDEIGLTPAMGWNNFNLTGAHIDQKIVLAAAHAMVDSGLAQHGWIYCNTDDGWQGLRGGKYNAIQPDSRDFPDIAGMVREIHGLGLKAGIYSSPWITTYDRHIGGTSNDPDGNWSTDFAKQNKDDHYKKFPFIVGQYHFADQDAKQFADWKFDYLKYDWAPVHADAAKEMFDALRATHRDFLLSLSNNGSYTLLKEIDQVSPYANSWRVTDDVHDNWQNIANGAFTLDPWAGASRPGHFNDPDMLVVGVVAWWGAPHPTHLTPDEQYTQISMWCLLSGPLLLGCDLQKLDPFTFSLISNDEVLDVDQDSLGKQATTVSKNGDINVVAKPLDDGRWAVGLFNRGPAAATATVKWADLKLNGKLVVRDLWRQKDLGIFNAEFSSNVPSHGVVMVAISQ
jgi:alpha-galactosidase